MFRPSLSNPSNTTEELLREARFKLRRLIWISALSVVFVYVGGHIHSAYGHVRDKNLALAGLAELVIFQEQNEILQEIMLGQKDALTRRTKGLEKTLKHKLNDESVCLVVTSDQMVLPTSSCMGDSLKTLLATELSSGGTKLASFQVKGAKVDEVEEAVKKSGPSLLVVLLCALLGIWLLYFMAERNVLKPLLELIRRRERDVTIAGTVQMLAHDIRRPLAMIDILLGQLRTATSAESIASLTGKYSPSIQKATQTLSNYLDDILIYGHDAEIQSCSVDISAVIKQSFEDLSLIKNASGCVLDLQCLGFICDVDPVKMRRVVDNILANAIDATGSNGFIQVSIKPESSHLQVHIDNQGEGIETSKLPLIFEPFFTTGKRNGTGLGLAIAKKFVEAHGGHLTCENLPGFGVRFTISLPHEAELHERAETSNAKPRSRLTALSQIRSLHDA